MSENINLLQLHRLQRTIPALSDEMQDNARAINMLLQMLQQASSQDMIFQSKMFQTQANLRIAKIDVLLESAEHTEKMIQEYMEQDTSSSNTLQTSLLIMNQNKAILTNQKNTLLEISESLTDMEQAKKQNELVNQVYAIQHLKKILEDFDG